MKIGIDLGGTNVRVALVDGNGIVKVIKEPCKADQPANIIVEHIIELINKIIIPDISGIGIGVPSAVDPQKGIVYNVMNIPSWKEVHIKDMLEKEFRIPTYVNNDANCFALGEKHYGLAKQYNNVVGITLGTGVGSGLIIDGKLYTGNNTCAGEIGCIPYLDYTYEDYCSSQFFKREYNTSGFEVYSAAKQNNAEALRIWEEFGRHVGNLVSMTIFAYDPEVIVFGGSIANASDLFAPAMKEKLKEFMFPNIIDKLKIDFSTNNDVGILGAASLVQ